MRGGGVPRYLAISRDRLVPVTRGRRRDMTRNVATLSHVPPKPPRSPGRSSSTRDGPAPRGRTRRAELCLLHLSKSDDRHRHRDGRERARRGRAPDPPLYHAPAESQQNYSSPFTTHGPAGTSAGSFFAAGFCRVGIAHHSTTHGVRSRGRRCLIIPAGFDAIRGVNIVLDGTDSIDRP